MRGAIAMVLAAGAVTLTPAAADAQGRTVHINFGGGPAFVLGDVATRFSTGWGPVVGVTVDLHPRISAQFEYAYRYFWLDGSYDLQAGPLDANHSAHQLDFNVASNLTKPDRAIKVYVIGGPGMYYRSVEVTKFESGTIVCDPWWYICGTIPIESIPGSRGGWDVGINVGGGAAFRFEGGEFYIESRYHYVWGPGIPVAIGSAMTVRTNGQYWPLTFGLRF